MFKKGISITVFLCLLAMSNGAYGVFRDIGFDGPETWNVDIWHYVTGDIIIDIPAVPPFDSDWHNPLNWGYWCQCPRCICTPVRPPDINTWAAIAAKPPEPSIIAGDAACSRLSVYPWSSGSWIVDESPFALTVCAGAGTINCGVQIGLCDKTTFDSSNYGYAVLNVYGGTMHTPGYTSPPPVMFCPPSGLYIGGGPLTPDGGTGLNYGIVNMYDGSIIVPGICINYGNVNLFGGLLYNTTADADNNFVISQSHARNKINVEGDGTSGGELRLQGDRAEQVLYYYAKGGICPCNKHGILFVDYNAVDNYTSVTALCTPGSAWDPTPADLAIRVVLNPTLTWSPGDWVQPVNGHAVYLGTDFNDVNEANDADPPGGAYKGRFDTNSYDPCELPAGVTCYWRVDEYNDAGGPDSNTVWKGQVWKFQTRGGEAIDPVPADEAVGLPILLQLSWTPGIWAARHDVYFGTSEVNVTEDTNTNWKGTYQGRQDANVFALDRLDYNLAPDTNYYWRIDEVNGTTIWHGETWHFVNTNYFIVDDFESYGSTADMNQRWDTQYSGAGGTLTLNEGTMQYDYDNSGLIYLPWSEAMFDAGGVDWTGGDALPNDDKARALVISYIGIGAPGNAADPNYDRMYVAIEDTDGNVGNIVTNSDPNAQRTTTWKQWNINLADLNSPDVNLRAVGYLYLGFGVRGNTTNPGGTGTVKFDDIRLYQSRCVPEYGPIADFTDDCVVNLDDTKVMSQEWLSSGEADIYTDGIVDFRDFAILA